MWLLMVSPGHICRLGRKHPNERTKAMPKFYVQVERVYTARHSLVYAVDADSLADARELVEGRLKDGSVDPTDDDYDDTQDIGGYDDAGSWHVADTPLQPSGLNAVAFPVED